MSRTHRLAVAAALALACGAGVAAMATAGCDSGSYYVYVARIYDSTRGCLSDVEAIDIVEGADPGLGCAGTCLVGPDTDGGTVVYATTMCGPPPYGVDTSGSDPRCAAALAALGRTDICLDGGGSTAPLPDASSD